jgi:taurine dioxygenase
LELNTQPLNDRFGVHIQGVGLCTLDDETLSAIFRVWQIHPLVLFRRQVMTESELVEFARYFGKLHVPEPASAVSHRHEGVMYVSNLKTENGERLGGLGSAELDWHTDQSYRETPATGSIFHAIEMPRGVGKIQWCNMQMAYDALPVRLQEQIASLEAISRYNAYEREKLSDDEKRRLKRRHPPVSHPLVLTDPVSGKRGLYLDISTAYAVKGMDDARARSLLDELAEVMTRPEFIYTHEWQPGDVMMWDNARLCHRRDAFDGHYPRLAKRVSVFLDPTAFPCP